MIFFALATHLGLSSPHHATAVNVILLCSFSPAGGDSLWVYLCVGLTTCSLIQLRERRTGNEFGLDQELLERTIFMSTLSLLLLRATLTDVLIALGAEDKAGKD